MSIPTPVAAWLFNKDLGESAGQYKDSIGGLVLTSNDGLDHPAAAAKIGAGAYAANNTADRRLTLPTGLPGEPNPDTAWTFAIWWRAASLIATFDRILEIGETTLLQLRYAYSTSTLIQRVSWDAGGEIAITNYQNLATPNTEWHFSLVTISARYETDDGYFVRLSPWLDGVAGTQVERWYDELPLQGLPLYLNGKTTFWNGDIDAFHVWDRELTAEEIAEVYNAGAGWEYGPDNTPDAFTFTNVTDADPSTLYVSDGQKITGMDAGTAVSITGGEYRINGGTWTSDAGTIDPGDTLELRATSSADPETTVTVSVTVGTVTVSWTITTAAGVTAYQRFVQSPGGIYTAFGPAQIVSGWPFSR